MSKRSFPFEEDEHLSRQRKTLVTEQQVLSSDPSSMTEVYERTHQLLFDGARRASVEVQCSDNEMSCDDEEMRSMMRSSTNEDNGGNADGFKAPTESDENEMAGSSRNVFLEQILYSTPEGSSSALHVTDLGGNVIDLAGIGKNEDWRSRSNYRRFWLGRLQVREPSPMPEETPEETLLETQQRPRARSLRQLCLDPYLRSQEVEKNRRVYAARLRKAYSKHVHPEPPNDKENKSYNNNHKNDDMDMEF